jgi:hypothetical protein
MFLIGTRDPSNGGMLDVVCHGRGHESDTSRFNAVWPVVYWAVLAGGFLTGAIITHGVARTLLLVPAALAGLLLLYTLWAITVLGPKLMKILEQTDEQRRPRDSEPD